MFDYIQDYIRNLQERLYAIVALILIGVFGFLAYELFVSFVTDLGVPRPFVSDVGAGTLAFVAAWAGYRAPGLHKGPGKAK